MQRVMMCAFVDIESSERIAADRARSWQSRPVSVCRVTSSLVE